MADEMTCICQYDGYVENKAGEIEYVGGAKTSLRSIQKNMVFSQFVQMMEEVSSNKENETFILIKHIVSGATCNVDNSSDYQAMFSLFRNNPQHPLRISITKHSIVDNPPPPRNVPAARNFFTIQPYSSLSKNLIEKYDSSEFESGGYKWKLSFYPNGNKKEEVKDHISLYLVMLDTTTLLPEGWEVEAVYRFFLFNHLKNKYMIIEGVSDGKFKRFRGSKIEWGFSYLIPLATFNDPSNGYLVNDTCKFGAEVFVSKWSANSQRLTVIKDDTSGKSKWNVELSRVHHSDIYYSDVFSVGGHKWRLSLSLTPLAPVWMCFALSLVPPFEKVHPTAVLRLRNQKTSKHLQDPTVVKHHWVLCQNLKLPDRDSLIFADQAGFLEGYWGKPKFIELDVLKNEANGFVVNGKFDLEAEVTVLG